MWNLSLIVVLCLALTGCVETQAPAKVVVAKPTVKRTPPKKIKKQTKIQNPKSNTTRNTKQAATLAWGWPTRGTILTKFSAGNATFKGIDIGGTAGTPILAAGDGEVVYSGNSLRGYGNLIIIKHQNNFLSAYAHNRKNDVKEGDRVVLGQRIAEMGQTGTDKVKLHFELRYQGKPVDPLGVLPAR